MEGRKERKADGRRSGLFKEDSLLLDSLIAALGSHEKDLNFCVRYTLHWRTGYTHGIHTRAEVNRKTDKTQAGKHRQKHRRKERKNRERERERERQTDRQRQRQTETKRK